MTKLPCTPDSSEESAETDLREIGLSTRSRTAPDNPERQREPWEEALDEFDAAPPDGAYPPDERDRNRAEGDDHGASRIAGAGKLIFILGALALLVPMFAVLFNNPGGEVRRELPPRVDALVLEIINGNTIKVELAGREQIVRYIGVEIAAPGDENYSLSIMVNEQLVAGREIELEADAVDTDLQGRLLRYVWVDRQIMVNANLLALGLGRFRNDGQNSRYSRSFDEIERNARERQLGIWNTTGRGA